MQRKMFQGITGASDGRAASSGAAGARNPAAVVDRMMTGMPSVGGLMDCGAEVARLASQDEPWTGTPNNYAAQDTLEADADEDKRSEHFLKRALGQSRRYKTRSQRSAKLVEDKILHGTKCTFLRAAQDVPKDYSQELSNAREEVRDINSKAVAEAQVEAEREDALPGTEEEPTLEQLDLATLD